MAKEILKCVKSADDGCGVYLIHVSVIEPIL